MILRCQKKCRTEVYKFYCDKDLDVEGGHLCRPNLLHQIRLCLNQIAPNNFENKINELRYMVIGDAKILGEEGFDEEAAKKV